MASERLQKFLSRAGVASRRRCEELVRAGRVTVNGQVAAVGDKVDPEADVVAVSGKNVRLPPARTYLLLHKPVGYVTTRQDEHGRPTVMDLLPPEYFRLHYVGRLDYDSSGLLLLTDDGELTQRLTHPRHELGKTYLATVAGRPGKQVLRSLAAGVVLEDGSTAPAQVRLLGPPGDRTSTLEITIREGRNRQVRRMCEAVGHPVLSLKRIAMGALSLGALPEGRYRLLTPAEVRKLGVSRY